MQTQDALAVHGRPVAAPQQPRTAISIGNAGALGEAVLARLLSAPQYRHVHVATTLPLRTTAPRLIALDYSTLSTPPAWQPVSNNHAAISDAVMIAGGRHSYFRRDDAFPILTESEVISLARNARANRCTRLMVIAPMDAWTAMTLSSIAHFDELEREIGAMGFETLIVVRPTANEARKPAGNWLDRIANGLMSTVTQYMISASRQPQRAQVVAEAAMEWFTTLPPGHHRQDATALQTWLEKRATKRASYG